MPKYATTSTKNVMRRSLLAILHPYPSPSAIQELWNYFGNSCAYCGIHLETAARNGQLDHVIPAAKGGTNVISNFVLACGRCNGDKKREMEWHEYLAQVEADPVIRASREAKIRDWLARAPLLPTQTPDPRVESVIRGALDAFDQAVSQLRNIRSESSSTV